MTQKKYIRRFSDTPLDEFLKQIRRMGDGLYIVGLDIHVGFLLNREGKIYFLHSSYKHPFCVVKEKASKSKILRSSRYRVIGKFSDDDALLKKWLYNEKIETLTDAD